MPALLVATLVMRSLIRESNIYLHGSSLNNLSKTLLPSALFVSKLRPRVAYPGLLAPLPIPDHAWHTVTLDFIEGLPKSAGYNCILVVVDKFSKYAHFVPLSHPFTALQVAIAYLNNIFKLHGLPTVMVLDRDKIFTSNI